MGYFSRRVIRNIPAPMVMKTTIFPEYTGYLEDFVREGISLEGFIIHFCGIFDFSRIANVRKLSIAS